jgi:hypothetical protein
MSMAPPQEVQERAAADTSLPQVGQFMIAAEYITATLQTLAAQNDCSRQTA